MWRPLPCQMFEIKPDDSLLNKREVHEHLIGLADSSRWLDPVPDTSRVERGGWLVRESDGRISYKDHWETNSTPWNFCVTPFDPYLELPALEDSTGRVIGRIHTHPISFGRELTLPDPCYVQGPDSLVNRAGDTVAYGGRPSSRDTLWMSVGAAGLDTIPAYVMNPDSLWRLAGGGGDSVTISGYALATGEDACIN